MSAQHLFRKLWLFAGLLACAARPTLASNTEFTILGGLNLSSPRTAVSTGVSNDTGIAGGFGFDYLVKGNAHIETELLYVIRRFGGADSLPTFMLPLIARFENKYLIVGLGPYLGMLLGATNDFGDPVTLDSLSHMNSVDIGMIVETGFKLPLTKTVSGFFDGRILRAITASYSSGTDSFYWGALQAYAGVQIRIGHAAQ